MYSALIKDSLYGCILWREKYARDEARERRKSQRERRQRRGWVGDKRKPEIKRFDGEERNELSNKEY
jgi:hypothetical protein